MKSWFGSFYLSAQQDPVEVTVLASGKDITIGYRQEDAKVQSIKWSIDELEASFDHSIQSTRIISLNDPGKKLLVAGKTALDYIQAVKDENYKPWHKKQKTKDWLRSLTVLFGIMTVLITAYLLLVPWLSEKIALTVEPETEAKFGNAVYDALALSNQEDKAASVSLNDFFREMNVTTDYNIRITAVKSDIVNAFALPGGNIVVYTGLLKQLNAYPELAALLSHEFTHVNNRHSTKSIFRQLGSRVFLALLFGNFGSVTSVLIDRAEQFKSLKYSRALEKEADMSGLEILKERKIDPEGFALLFRRLKNAAPGSALPEFLGSHPDINKRINYIREASGNSQVEQHPQLDSIFKKIKQVK